MFHYDEQLYNVSIANIEEADANFKTLLSDSAPLLGFPPAFPYASTITQLVDEINKGYISFSREILHIMQSNSNNKKLSVEQPEEQEIEEKGFWDKIKNGWNDAKASIKKKISSIVGKNKFIQALFNVTGAKFSNKIRSKLSSLFGLKSETINPAFFDHDREDLAQEKLIRDQINRNEKPTVILPSLYALPHHARKKTMENGKEICDARIAILGGYQPTDAQQRELLQTIDVPVWTGTERSTISITVNKKLVKNFQNAFEKAAELKFPIQHAEAYSWEHTMPDGVTPSEHRLGGTIDINSEHNFGSGDNSEYAVRPNEEVMRAFEEQGFFWGGEWEGSTTDDMHFSFTGY